MFHTILSHCQMLVKKKKTTTKKLYPRPISTPNCGARRDTMLPSILVFCQDGATSSIVTKSSPEEIQSIIVFGPTKNKSNFTQRTAELCAPNCSAFAPVIEVLALCSKEEHFHGLEKSCFLLFFFFLLVIVVRKITTRWWVWLRACKIDWKALPTARKILLWSQTCASVFCLKYAIVKKAQLLFR